ncbi:MAG: PAS domain S-box protein [Methanoregula sp.]|nr:PAS domain S-box protein [Methanoregula sp.]
MDFLHFDQVNKRPILIPGLIGTSAAVTMALNLYGLTHGITNVLPHLLYIPIILAAYYYPRWGVPFTLLLSALYCGAVFALYPASMDVLTAALARGIVFIIIAAVISFLSGRMYHDTQMCRRLVSIVASSGDAIVAETFDGIITDWNTSAEKLYGYTSKEILGKSVAILLPPDKRDESKFLLQKIQNGIHVDRYETERLTKTGKIIQVSLSLSPIKNITGELVGASVSAHDISDKKQLLDEILQTKIEWERTFDAVPDMIAIIGRDFHIVRVNRAMADRLRIDPEDAAGKACYDLVSHSTTSSDSCPHGKLLGDGKEHAQEVHEDALNADFLVTASPLFDEEGNVTGSVHVMRDITERKHAENALRIANNKLTMLSSITRHDILNKLTGLRMYLELSKESVTDPVFLDYIAKEIDAAGAIERQIEFTRFYENIGVNAPQWHDVTERIRSAVSQLPLEEINFDILLPSVQVYADALIEKVFYNLIENSLRHGEGVKEIRFSFDEMPDGAVITYHDDGRGISPADKDKLFRRGFGKHTGLGLFLSREILSITGITITENGEPGKGVHFEIRVPKGSYRFTSPQPV